MASIWILDAAYGGVRRHMHGSYTLFSSLTNEIYIPVIRYNTRLNLEVVRICTPRGSIGYTNIVHTYRASYYRLSRGI